MTDIYLITNQNETIACFRDEQEANEYIHMIKEISKHYYHEHDLIQHRPAKDLQNLLSQYKIEMLALITKHLPRNKKAVADLIAGILVDNAALDDFEIIEIPLTSFHLQEKLKESKIRIKIR